ncbi:unnamed protein product [Spirodela intermedia]|uniref:Membrane insertase YidC/Oxa/ALB C-terminal domain-containing protein n=1 Tax=Spirodela intermedia TaxID=51605 RepID=A0A7I8L4D7_SPIIN|nr:unnamed protein product [Spirodela intermedia]
MGATRLLASLRRLRPDPSASALFGRFQNTGPFPLRGGAFSRYGSSHDSLRLRSPFLGTCRQLSSLDGLTGGGGGHEDGEVRKGAVSIEGSDLHELCTEGGEDSLWYAPVRGVISLLDGYHEFTGLPWWITIASSTFALRVSILPVLLLQFKKMRKLSELFPKLPPPLPPPFSGKSFTEQFMLFRKKRLELGCPSYLWNFVYVSVQIPCFFVWMFSIRRMSLDNHPGFDCGGILWFQNLTASPEGALGCIFPILIGGLHFLNVQISFQTIKLAKMSGIFGLLAKYYKLYLDILTFPLLLIAFNIPQGSLVYWVTNSSLTLVQQLCFRHPNVRKMVGLPETTSPAIPKENRPPEKKLPTDDQVPLETLPPQKLLELALNLMNEQSQDEALPLLRLATERDPDLVKAFIALGQIYCSRGSLEEAAEYFELALSKSGEHEVDNIILASFGAGFSRINQGKKEEGIDHLRRIAQMKEPEKPTDKASYYTALVLLGSTLYNDGEKSEAARYLRMAAAYDPAVNAYLKQCEEE